MDNGNIYNPNSVWLGVIENGNEVYNTGGLYIGTVMSDDRIVRNKSFQFVKRIPIPRRPLLTPFRPIRPFKRLLMPKLFGPYEDVFEGQKLPVRKLVPKSELRDFGYLLGAELIASDETFLGEISLVPMSEKSITNRFNKYGNEYSAISIFNQYGNYGSEYSALSPNNEYATNPPRIEREGEVLGYLSVNTLIPNRVDTNDFLAWLNLVQSATI
ncbi:MAG: hypothetical protein D8M60_18580 [Chloroflexi bacterium]|nr:hypothetical protein [Chloroflexota bacterium]